MDIITNIIKTEGGYVNHPNDRGGPTKYGITLKTYKEYTKNYFATEEDIKNLNKEKAYEIYEQMYLIDTKIINLTNGILREIALDMAVNFGPSTAIKIIQETINRIGEDSLVEDGILGPNTEKIVNKTFEYMGRYFINLICDVREEKYRNIVKRNPSQQVFLKGWINRTDLFRTKLPLIKGMEY